MLPSELLRRARPGELGRLLALQSVEPWGEYRADLRSGVVAARLAPAFLSKPGGDGFMAKDFMLDFEERPPVDPVTLSKQFRAVFGAPMPVPGSRKVKEK